MTPLNITENSALSAAAVVNLIAGDGAASWR
jgi:hypothetical protein